MKRSFFLSLAVVGCTPNPWFGVLDDGGDSTTSTDVESDATESTTAPADTGAEDSSGTTEPTTGPSATTGEPPPPNTTGDPPDPSSTGPDTDTTGVASTDADTSDDSGGTTMEPVCGDSIVTPPRVCDGEVDALCSEVFPELYNQGTTYCVAGCMTFAHDDCFCDETPTCEGLLAPYDILPRHCGDLPGDLDKQGVALAALKLGYMACVGDIDYGATPIEVVDTLTAKLDLAALGTDLDLPALWQALLSEGLLTDCGVLDLIFKGLDEQGQDIAPDCYIP